MTKLLEKALEAVRRLPDDGQDEIARAMLALAGEGGDSELLTLTDDERNAIARSKTAASRGDFATDQQVAAVWSKHGL